MSANNNTLLYCTVLYSLLDYTRGVLIHLHRSDVESSDFLATRAQTQSDLGCSNPCCLSDPSDFLRHMCLIFGTISETCSFCLEDEVLLTCKPMPVVLW
jgi:hypothetical protein